MTLPLGIMPVHWLARPAMSSVVKAADPDGRLDDWLVGTRFIIRRPPAPDDYDRAFPPGRVTRMDRAYIDRIVTAAAATVPVRPIAAVMIDESDEVRELTLFRDDAGAWAVISAVFFTVMAYGAGAREFRVAPDKGLITAIVDGAVAAMVAPYRYKITDEVAAIAAEQEPFDWALGAAHRPAPRSVRLSLASYGLRGCAARRRARRAP